MASLSRYIAMSTYMRSSEHQIHHPHHQQQQQHSCIVSIYSNKKKYQVLNSADGAGDHMIYCR